MKKDLIEQSQNLFQEGKYKEALACAETFLQKEVASCDALYIQAMCYMHLGEAEKGLACVRQSKQIDVNYIGAYMAEAYIYKRQGRIVTEMALLQQIILHIERLQAQEKSDCYSKSLCEAWSLLGSAYTLMGQPDKALNAFLTASRLEQDKNQQIKEYSNALFVTNYMADIAIGDMRKLHEAFQQFFLDVPQFSHFLIQKECLRIGYISPDFRQHPVAYFISSLLGKYTREIFDAYCYVLNESDEVTRQLQKMGGKWRNVHKMEPAAIARLIYEDQIDILVDLSGHTKGSCLPVLAYKPAPIQMTGIGYFNTTGLKAMDYILTDRFCAPENEAAKEFTEQLIRLPYSHFCYSPLKKFPKVAESPARKNGYVTFGCFNNFNKVTDQVLLIWREVLQGTPNSRLILKSKIFDSEEGREFVRSRLLQLGFSLDIVDSRGFSPDYLEQYNEIDIALDTFPYTGGATTCEALYMGVPVVTLCGGRHGARFGYSLLKNAGLDELIAGSETEYIEKAKLLARDLELLAGLRQNLRHIVEKSDLMNEEKYVVSVEQAYQKVWQEKQMEQDAEKIGLKELEAMRQKLLAFIDRRDYLQAEVLAQRLLQKKPDDKELLGILIGICIETNQAEKAHAPLERLCNLYPMYGYGEFLAARVDYLENRWLSVINKVEHALQHCRDLTNPIKSMLYNLLGAAYKDYGEAEKSTGCYLKASRYAGNMLEKAVDYSNYLFNLHYLSQLRAEKMHAEHEKYNQFFMQVIPYVHQPRQREKIRIGYISPDIRQHVVTFFSYALFKQYDHVLFEVTCYAKCKEDAISEQIKGLVDHWRNIQGLEPHAAAALIFADGIDILFDLSGHTRNNCLPIMAYKPAPIQICGIGYFDTTGLKTMDYFLGDVYTDDVHKNEDIFTEKILRMPHSHFCYVPPDTMPGCIEMPCKKKQYITFGSFNNFTKTTDEMLTVWKEILERVPKSRLLLKSKIFAAEEGASKVRQRLQNVGISLERVEMRPESGDYLKQYGDVDIALDTYPYPGGGTTCEALYMGVPVVTLVGKRHGSRFGYSLLKNLGLVDCCAFSKAEYVEVAVKLAMDKARLSELHRSLRLQIQASPLMDGALYMQGLEEAYLRIAQPFCRENRACTDQTMLLQQVQTLFSAKKWEAVVQVIRKMLLETVTCPDLFSLLTQAYFKLGDYSRGIATAKLALGKGYCRENAEFLIRLGTACKEALAYADAEQYFAWAISCLAKNRLETQQELFTELKTARAQLLVSMGRTQEGAELYRQVSEEHPVPAQKYVAYGSYLLSLHYEMQDARWLYKEHARYADFFQDVVQYKHSSEKTHKRIRVGYLSPDFRQHVMFYFYHVLLTRYNKVSFEVYCYSLAKTEDAFTGYLKPFVTSWVDVSACKDDEIAKIIYNDEIDILVDLAGHSAGSGLASLAYKPAPIQMSGWGYVNTTGLSAVDYFITDEIVDPPEAGNSFFSEKLLRLPKTQFCYTGRSDVPIPKGAPCKGKGYITFACFNNFAKITDNMLALWLRIMNAVSDARLILKSQVFVSPQAVELARQRLKRVGYDLSCVSFAPATDDYMVQYLEVDVALDTYPYPGGGTTCDALYMGVPVVSLYGEFHGTRFGYSLLKNIGLEELAVKTEAEYIEKTVALAKDWDLLEILHKNLRQMMLESPLMDEIMYVRDLEEEYTKIYLNKKTRIGKADIQ